MAMQERDAHEVITLLASGARTETSTGETAVRLPGMVNAFAFTLDLTAAATEVDDTLDVYIQTMLDGAKWTDVVHFTQVLGNGGAKRYIEKIAASAASAGFEVATALGGGETRDLVGDEWRVRYDVTDAGTTNASFTFSVTACLM